MLAAFPDCSALILCGGQGRRMGYRDKGLVLWQGLPMAEHLCRLLRPLVPEILISCNRNLERYAALADRVIVDEQTDYPGPLAGIVAALPQVRGQRLLLLPCDLPALDAALLEQLYRLARTHPDQPVAVRQGDYLQPLVCIIPMSLRLAVESAWNAGERSPARLWRSLDVREYACDEDDIRLSNCNTAERLASLRPPSR